MADSGWFERSLSKCAARATVVQPQRVATRAAEVLRLVEVKLPAGRGPLRGLEHCLRAVALDYAARESGIQIDRRTLAAECGATTANLDKAAKLAGRVLPEPQPVDLPYWASQVLDGSADRVVEAARSRLGDNPNHAEAAAAFIRAADELGVGCDRDRLSTVTGVPTRDMVQVPSTQPARLARKKVSFSAAPSRRSPAEADGVPAVDDLSPFDDWARDVLADHFATPNLPALTRVQDVTAAFDHALAALPAKKRRRPEEQLCEPAR